MASSTARVSLRVALLLLLLLIAFYVGRPLYWKLSATIHDIRENKQSVKEGFSQFVIDARKSVGWYHDESDPGFAEDQSSRKIGVATARRILRVFDSKIKR